MNIFTIKFKAISLLFSFFLWSGLAQASLNPLEQQILGLTNQARQKAGLGILTVNPQLVVTAKYQSALMAQNNQLTHVVKGLTLSMRLKGAGYAYKHSGENIAYGTNKITVARIFQGWMKSKGHRKNIMGKDFTEIGIGMAVGKHGKIYYTQVFGKRK